MGTFRRRAIAVRWILPLLALAAILPVQGQSQQNRSRKPPAPRCTVTADELDALTTLLDEIEQEPDMESEETVEEPANSEQSPLCTSELARLRNSIRRLQSSFQRLKQTVLTVDPQTYQRSINLYEQKKRDLQEKLSGLESRLSTQQRTQIRELKKKIVELEKQLNASVTQLEKQRQDNANIYVGLVVTHIDKFQQVQAEREFQNLMSYSTDPYAEIVKQLRYTSNMIYFLRNVNFKHKPIAGYEALVDTMIERRLLHGYYASVLLTHIQSLILARDGQQQQRALALLKKFKMNAQ